MDTHTVVGGGGTELCVGVTGPPDAAPVVLVHDHSSFWEAPARFDRELRAFVDRC